jgi:hypothetical protein
VEVLSRDAVAHRLNLPNDLAAWLDSLEAVGPPTAPLQLPRDDAARRLLERLGVVEPDQSTIVAVVNDIEQSPEWIWLMERACHRIQSEIGDSNAGSFLPVLPKELGIQADCFWVFVFLATAESIHAWHTAHGISDAISWATLADLGLHVARNRLRHGSSGLEFPTWLGLHWRGELYALGRLQFNPFRLRTGPAGPLFWYEGAALDGMSAAFQPGAPVLGVHVPAGVPLDPAACDASFQAAASFFPRFFPEHASRLAVCTSWLLDEQLADYLPAESNIVRFQRRFELVPGARDSDDGMFLWIFDRVPNSVDELQPRTELERAVVRHVRDGHHWRLRTGWLEI